MQIFAIVLSWMGLMNSAYLSYLHAFPAVSSPLCGPGASCGKVLGRSFAEIRGIPIAWAGVALNLFFLVAFLTSYGLPDGRARHRLLRLALWGSLAGLLASSALVYIQLGVLKSLCPLCLASAGIIVCVFILSLGFSEALLRFSSLFRGQEQKEKIKSTVLSVFKMAYPAMLMLLLAVILFAPQIAVWLRKEGLTLLIRILSVRIFIFNCPDRHPSSVGIGRIARQCHFKQCPIGITCSATAKVIVTNSAVAGVTGHIVEHGVFRAGVGLKERLAVGIPWCGHVSGYADDRKRKKSSA